MIESVALSVFPSPLLRLILCGGGGLAAAWGPLVYEEQVRWSWDPARGFVQMYHDTPIGISYWRGHPIHGDVGWSLPLDASSPWPARLAMVAAWMLKTPRCGFASVIQGERGVNLGVLILSPDGLPREYMLGWWDRKTGKAWRRTLTEASGVVQIVDHEAHDLPLLEALPVWLSSHPPAVALLLALYDVPEIGARVEAACPT